MKNKIQKFDIAKYLDDEESIAEYLNAVLAENDSNLLLSAIGDIAKAIGMSQISENSGLGRESLYKALAPGAKPRFDTIIKVLSAIGLNLQMHARI